MIEIAAIERDLGGARKPEGGERRRDLADVVSEPAVGHGTAIFDHGHGIRPLGRVKSDVVRGHGLAAAREIVADGSIMAAGMTTR